MHRQRLLVGFLTLVVGVLAAIGRSEAQVPQPIRYHGQALNAQGVPLEGTHTLVFRLYDAETGGQKMWEETQPNIPLSDGEFTVLLGQTTSLASLNWIARPLWFAIQVDNDAERSPRQRIAGAPVPLSVDELDPSVAPNLLSNGSLESWSKGTTVAPDGWTLEGGGRPTVTKNTTSVQRELASATVTNTAGNPGYLKQTVRTISSTTNTQLRGATVTLSCWVKTSNASLVQLIINEGPRLTRSAYHSGSGSYELLSVTTTLQNDATELTAYLFIDGGPSGTATFDGATLVQGPAALALNVRPAPPVQFRGTICTDCFGELVLAGHPNDPNILIHAAFNQVNLSTDGGRTWTVKNLREETTSPQAFMNVQDARVVTTNDGSFFIASLATLFSSGFNKDGGVLFQGNWASTLERSIFQGIPSNDTHTQSFSFVDIPQLAVVPQRSFVYVLSDTWFEDTQGFGTGFYVSSDGGKTFQRSRLSLPDIPSISVSTPTGTLTLPTPPLKLSLALDANGTLFGLYAYPTVISVGAPVKARTMRFSTFSPPSVNVSPPFDTMAHLVPAKRSPTVNRPWEIDQGPIFLIDASPTSSRKGRWYVIGSREERVVTDPTFDCELPVEVALECHAYGTNYDIVVSHSDDQGQTWSAPMRVNDDATSTDQVYPSARLDATGTLHIVWVDRRNHANEELVDVFYAFSKDGGDRFSKNLKLNEQSILMFRRDANGQEVDVFGDYLDVVAPYADRVYVALPHITNPTSPVEVRLVQLGGSPSNRAPSIGLVQDQTIEAGQTLQLTIESSDPDPGDTLTYAITNAPGGAAINPATGVFTWTPTPAQVGPHSVTFTVSDAGGQSASQTITIEVRATTPPLTVNAGPDQTLTLPTDHLTLTGRLHGGGDAASVHWSQVSGPGSVSFSAPTSLTTTASFPPIAGTYVLRLSATEGSASSQDEVEITVKAANAPPTVAFLTPADGAVFSGPTAITLEATATDSDGSIKTVEFFDVAPDGTTTKLGEATAAPYRLTTPEFVPGTVVVEARATNEQGASASRRITLTVVPPNRPPVWAPTRSQTVLEQQRLAFTVSASDPEGGPLVYSVSGLLPGATFDPATGVFTWTPTFEQAGDYLLSFTATEAPVTPASLSAGPMVVRITVVNVNRPPAIISSPLQGYAVNGGDTLSVPVEALDPDHTPLSYHFRFCRPNAGTAQAVCRDSAEGADFDPVSHLFRWTPVRSQTGLNTVTVTVSDGELQATQDLSVLVIFPNRPPVLQGTIAQTARYTPTPVTAPLPASFQQGAVDPNGDPLEFFWDFGDGTAQASGQQVSHTYAAPGVYTYTVTVSDGIDLVRQSHNIEIVIPTVVPPPPVAASVTPGVDPRRLLP